MRQREYFSIYDEFRKKLEERHGTERGKQGTPEQRTEQSTEAISHGRETQKSEIGKELLKKKKERKNVKKIWSVFSKRLACVRKGTGGPASGRNKARGKALQDLASAHRRPSRAAAAAEATPVPRAGGKETSLGKHLSSLWLHVLGRAFPHIHAHVHPYAYIYV